MTEGASREQQIAEIEATLQFPSIPESVRELLEKQLQDLRADKVSPLMQGTINMSDDGRIGGVAVGLNLGHIIFGRDPEEDERRRLVWYLTRLASKLYRLPLRGLDEQLEQAKGIGLPQVYVMLASNSSVAKGTQGPREVLRYFNSDKRTLKKEYDPNWALPSETVRYIRLQNDTRHIGETIPLAEFQEFLKTKKVEVKRGLLVFKPVLLTAAVRDHRVMLLGGPGSGKSTFLRHLAWVLSQRGLDQLKDAATLRGREDRFLMLPIMLPLRTLAGKLAQQGQKEKDSVVTAALHDELQHYNIGQVDDLLSEALHHGTVLLLCDGLDEVPSQALPEVADRSTVLAALKSFTSLYREISIVVTCRTRAFDNGSIGSEWRVHEVAPFTLGQIRHFVPAWYHELAATGQIDKEQASRLEQKLMEAILGNKKLQDLARTPLLLTMMALVLYNKNELPRDRPQLYERILELLLGQWDKVRDGQSLSEAIGQPDWGSERIRPVLDLLSYQAHAEAASADGRGRLRRSAVRDALIEFFEKARLPESWESAHRCLNYFEQRSGLVQPDEDDTYIFAHLTLQEHCAGRYMMLHRDAVKLVMQHRGDDRWREPLFLGLGVIQQTKPELIDRILMDLIDHNEGGCSKPDDRWQRDLILAAEIGEDRDWNYLRTQQVNVERLQRNLKQGLVQLLQDQRQLLPATERIRAAFLLGNLGDPRFPVTVTEWQKAIEQALKGDTSGYFCCVKPGTYIMGSSDDDPDADDSEKPQHTVTFDAPYLIARYPITNAQQLEWVKSEKDVYIPYSDHPEFLYPNQPYCGIKLHEAERFCAWLSKQTGYVIRLPNEYEWEAAARGGDARLYPWGDSWQEDRVAISRPAYNPNLPDLVEGNFPVGCYPAGSSPCGALDMASNVFELTGKDVSIEKAWNSVPAIYKLGPKKPPEDADFGVIRGASTSTARKHFRCAARRRTYFNFRTYQYGFRVMVPVPA